MVEAQLHHYDETSTTLDYEGDRKQGWYYQFLNEKGIAISSEMGPYHQRSEAEAACQREFDGLH